MFVTAALLLLAGGLYVRAHNASVARQKADAVVALDKTGADTSVDRDDLKSYVATHMGASVTYTLSGSFDAAEAAAKAAANASSGTAQIYADAQRICGGKTDSITQAKCNQQYIQSHLANLPTPTPVVQPKLSDYQYKLRAPLWTADLAGALLLGGIAALALAFLRMPRRRR